MSPSDREWGAFTEDAPWVLDFGPQYLWGGDPDGRPGSASSAHAQRHERR